MNLKKTALASAIALALGGGSVWAKTTTKDVKIIVDKDQVRAGEIVNVAIMGLDGNGNIDRYGENDGSVIIATVKSKLGKVMLGSTTPGEVPKDDVANSDYAPFVTQSTDKVANISYVRLLHGVGRVHIVYPTDAQYTDSSGNLVKDELTVLLQERYSAGENRVSFDDIAGIGITPTDCPANKQPCPTHDYDAAKVGPQGFSVGIKPPSTDPGRLDIVGFRPAGTWDWVNETGQPMMVTLANDPAWIDTDMMRFYSTVDPRGIQDVYRDVEPNGVYDNDDGVQGAMTAGQRGGVIYVEAENKSINGMVRVTLTQVSDPIYLNAIKGDKTHPSYDNVSYVDQPQKYQYVVPMFQGRATVVLDSNVTKAAEYYIKAEFRVLKEDGSEEYKYSSVDIMDEDTVKVYSTGMPTKLDLNIVSDRIVAAPIQGNQNGTPVIATLIDEYGNPTTNNSLYTGLPETPIIAKVSTTDGNAAPLTLTIPNGKTKSLLTMTPGAPQADAWLGNAPGEIVQSATGNITLNATVDLPNGKKLTGSDSVRVLGASLVATPIFNQTPRAGADFDAFVITTTDGKAPSKISSQNLSTKETSTVRRNDSTNVVQARFLKATIIEDEDGLHRWYLVSDEDKAYAQSVQMAQGIGTNAGITVDLKNAHDESLTTFNETTKKYESTLPRPKYNITENTFQNKIPEVSLTLSDCFGNAVTGDRPEDQVGTFKAKKTPNATMVYTKTAGADYGVPNRDKDGAVVLTYNATGDKQFAGEEQIEVSFTKPGLVVGKCKAPDVTTPETSADPFLVTSVVEALVNKNKKIMAYVDGEEKERSEVQSAKVLRIPTYSEVPLTVEVLMEDGKAKDGTPLYRIFSDFKNSRLKVTYDTKGVGDELWTPAISEVNGVFLETPIKNNQVLDFTTNQTVGGTNGRKVFVVYAGPVARKPFKVTFTAVDEKDNPIEGLSITRTIEIYDSTVDSPIAEDCQKDATKCLTQTECERRKDGPSVFIKSYPEGKRCQPADDKINAFSSEQPLDQKYAGDAQFKGGISKNKGAFKVKDTVKVNDPIVTAGVIKVESEDVGKPADIVVGGFHTSTKDEKTGYQWSAWYMLSGCDVKLFGCPSQGWIVELWETNEAGLPILSMLKPLTQINALPEFYTVYMYEGNFVYKGDLQIYFGYVLTEGDQASKVVWNLDPIEVTIE